MSIGAVFTTSKASRVRDKTLAVLALLEFDARWTPSLRQDIASGEDDIRSILYHLASKTRPAVYLETGVRRGWSMACVGAAAPGCRLVGFDKWTNPYGNSPNPGPDFVRSEVAKTGHIGEMELISGDTFQTLPAWLAAHPGLTIDLALIDGDHTQAGAANDLTLIIPRLSHGGYLVIDDLCAEWISGAWQAAMAANLHLSHGESGIVGIARNSGGGIDGD
jgi:predicted O-methyltransferase YrrM